MSDARCPGRLVRPRMYAVAGRAGTLCAMHSIACAHHHRHITPVRAARCYWPDLAAQGPARGACRSRWWRQWWRQWWRWRRRLDRRRWPPIPITGPGLRSGLRSSQLSARGPFGFWQKDPLLCCAEPPAASSHQGPMAGGAVTVCTV